MSLFALIAALLLEQLHPLSSRKYQQAWQSAYVAFFQHHFNAGKRKHGKIAWFLAVLPLLACVIAIYWLLYYAHPWLAFLFNVLVLYLIMGFRRFSHFFTDIHHALRDDNLEEARVLLSSWRGTSTRELNAGEVARLAIEEALIASYRNVFGVILWFVLFSAIGLGGAAGALLYRLGQWLHSCWCHEELGEFGDFAAKAYYVLEWLPLRMTAATFAVVGDFEDTVYCWRTQALSWPDSEVGILLASGAGALGVRLGMPIPQDGRLLDRPELGVGDDADVDYLRSTTGLVWRSVVFLLILLLLLTLASLLS